MTKGERKRLRAEETAPRKAQLASDRAEIERLAERYGTARHTGQSESIVPGYPYQRPLQPLVQAMDPGPPQIEPTVYQMIRDVLKLVAQDGLDALDGLVRLA